MMSTLETVLLVLLIIDALALTILVLLQQGGADVGAAFGSGSSNTMFGSSWRCVVYDSRTTWLAVAFFAIAFGLAYTAKERAAAAGQIGIPQAVTPAAEQKLLLFLKVNQGMTFRSCALRARLCRSGEIGRHATLRVVGLCPCGSSPAFGTIPNRPEIALQVERGIPIIRVPIDAGWSSLVARRAHNPKVVGSNPPRYHLGKPLTRGFLLLRPMIGPVGEAARPPNVWSLSVNDFFALAHRVGSS